MADVTKIGAPDDPRLAPYRELKRKRAARREGRFIVEGKLLVERLLASRFEVESVVTVAGRRLPENLPSDGSIPVFELEPGVAEALVGFPFHRGWLACGRRETETAVPESLLSSAFSTLVALPQTSLDFNLGSIIRSTSALGGDGVLVGGTSADPFSRRVLRGSMGEVLYLPIIEPPSLSDTVDQLREGHGFELVVLSREEGAVPLPVYRCPRRVVLWVGHEGEGVSPTISHAADAVVTIPMDERVDSLNASAAAAIALYQFELCRSAGRRN